MLRKNFLVLVVFSLVLLSGNSFSAQYENYEWGILKEDAIKQVKQNGYKIEANESYDDEGQNFIGYNDTLFNEEIMVALLFTPISQKLCAITISSDEESVGRKLKDILFDKYGKPHKPNQFMDKYYFTENGKISLILKYTFDTKILYYSKYYYNKTNYVRL